jgi:toxic protein SymE
MAQKTKIRYARIHARCCVRESSWNGLQDFPWLNVYGRWLEEAGFKMGDPLEITVRKNKLVIKNLSGGGDTSN